MATVGSLLINLVAKTGQFDSKMKKSGQRVSTFGSQLQSVKRMAMGFGAALAGLVAVRSLTRFIGTAMEAIDTIAKLSDRIGVTTEALRKFEYMARITGVGTEGMHKSLEIYVRRMGEAMAGTGEATRGLEMLNLRAEDLAALGTENAVYVIADQINKLALQSEKAAAAYYLFGRAGSKMLNMFTLGTKGMKEMGEYAVRAGFALSRIDAAKVEEAVDAIERAKMAFGVFFEKMTIQFAPFITAAGNALKNFGTSGEGVGKALVKAFEAVAITIARIVDKIIDVIARMIFEMAAAADSFGRTRGMVPGLVRAGNALADIPSLALKVASGFDKIKDAAEKAALETDILNKQLLAGGGEGIEEMIVKMEELEKAAKGVFTATRTPMEQYEKKIGELGEMLAAGPAVMTKETYGRAIQQAREALEAASKVPVTAVETAAQGVFDATRTQMEQYEKKIGELSEMLDKSLITPETYSRAIQQARAGLESTAPTSTSGTAMIGSGINAQAVGFATSSPENTQKETLTETKVQSKIQQEILAALRSWSTSGSQG